MGNDTEHCLHSLTRAELNPSRSEEKMYPKKLVESVPSSHCSYVPRFYGKPLEGLGNSKKQEDLLACLQAYRSERAPTTAGWCTKSQSRAQELKHADIGSDDAPMANEK